MFSVLLVHHAHLEAGFGLFIQPLEWVDIFSTAAGKVRVVLFLALSVLLSLAALALLGHGMDLTFGRVKHDRQDLQVTQQPRLAESRALTAFADQQVHKAGAVHGLLSLFTAVLLPTHTHTHCLLSAGA